MEIAQATERSQVVSRALEFLKLATLENVAVTRPLIQSTPFPERAGTGPYGESSIVVQEKNGKLAIRETKGTASLEFTDSAGKACQTDLSPSECGPESLMRLYSCYNERADKVATSRAQSLLANVAQLVDSSDKNQWTKENAWGFGPGFCLSKNGDKIYICRHFDVDDGWREQPVYTAIVFSEVGDQTGVASVSGAMVKSLHVEIQGVNINFRAEQALKEQVPDIVKALKPGEVKYSETKETDMDEKPVDIYSCVAQAGPYVITATIKDHNAERLTTAVAVTEAANGREILDFGSFDGADLIYSDMRKLAA